VVPRLVPLLESELLVLDVLAALALALAVFPCPLPATDVKLSKIVGMV
jgi:hypothetical protein